MKFQLSDFFWKIKELVRLGPHSWVTAATFGWDSYLQGHHMVIGHRFFVSLIVLSVSAKVLMRISS